MPDLHPAAVAAVAALLGGVAGGALVRVTTKAPAPAASASREPGAALADTGDLARRVAQLEQNASRSERSRRVERAAQAAAPGDEPAAAAPGNARPTIDDPVFETAVRDIIDQINEERREERDARQAERRQRMAESWTQDMAAELGLNDAQKQKVAKVVQEYFESLRAMRDSDAGPGSRDEWRQRARAEREKAETKLGQVLDSGQMEKYKGLDDSKKLGSGGGGRRRQRD